MAENQNRKRDNYERMNDETDGVAGLTTGKKRKVSSPIQSSSNTTRKGSCETKRERKTIVTCQVVEFDTQGNSEAYGPTMPAFVTSRGSYKQFRDDDYMSDSHSEAVDRILNSLDDNDDDEDIEEKEEGKDDDAISNEGTSSSSSSEDKPIYYSKSLETYSDSQSNQPPSNATVNSQDEEEAEEVKNEESSSEEFSPTIFDFQKRQQQKQRTQVKANASGERDRPTIQKAAKSESHLIIKSSPLYLSTPEPKTMNGDSKEGPSSSNYCYCEKVLLQPSLILPVWEINSDDIVDCKMDSQLLNYLHGIDPTLAIEEICDFLDSKPHNQLGYGVMGILMMDYARNLPMDKLINLFVAVEDADKRKKESSDEESEDNYGSKKVHEKTEGFYVAIIKLVLLHRAQRAVFQMNNADNVVNYLPSHLLQLIDLESPMTLHENAAVDKMKDVSKGFLTLACKLIYDFANATDVSSNCPLYFGNAKSWEQRCDAWFQIATLLQNYIQQSLNEPLLSMLLQRGRTLRLGTRTYLYLVHETHKASFDLHSYFVRKSVIKSAPGTFKIKTVKVTMMESEIFVDLMYGRRKVDPTEITFGVYKIAEALHVKGISKFLYGEDIDFKNLGEVNKAILFPILLKIGTDEDVDFVAKRFHCWMPAVDYDQCIKNCSADMILKFFSRDDVFLDEIVIYKMLLNWACYSAGVNYTSFDDFRPTSKIKEKFDAVVNCLRLGRLLRHRNNIVRHNLISISDWMLARKVMQGDLSPECAIVKEGRFNIRKRVQMQVQ